MAPTRDNKAMYVPPAFIKPAQFRAAVARVERRFPQVVRIIPEFRDDWTGEPSVFFMVILDDAAASHDQLLKISNQVSDTIDRQVQPREKWGLFSYFNFRTRSEQAQMDPASLA
jgi:hypothetical protein